MCVGVFLKSLKYEFNYFLRRLLSSISDYDSYLRKLFLAEVRTCGKNKYLIDIFNLLMHCFVNKTFNKSTCIEIK